MKRSVLLFLIIFLSLDFSNGLQSKEKIDDKVVPQFMVWDNEHNFSSEKSENEIKDYLIKYRDHNITKVFLLAKNETYKRVAPIAKSVGVEIHAWRWTMNRPNQELMESHKDWYTYNKNNESCIDKPPYVGYYRWLCPNEPEVIDYLVNDYLEIARIEGISGIHFDYIRYCDIFLPIGLWEKYNLVQDHEMPEFDYCYCHRCREGFKKDFGVDPIEINDSLLQQQWKEWRLKSIVNVVNTIASKVKEETDKIITAAVFPTPKMSIDMVRQDWGKFKIDAVCPMLYNEFYHEDIDWIGECVKEGIETMEYKKDLYAGLMVLQIKESKQFKKAIKTALKNGAKAVVFFSSNSLTEAHYNILKDMEF